MPEEREGIPPLIENQVHLWISTPSLISGTALTQEYLAVLNGTEKERYHRFHFEKDRHRHLITRALVRSALTHYEPAVKAGEWAFIHNEYGKPSIATATSNTLEFNISHSEDLIVLALTNKSAVGVDIENIRERNNFQGLIDHCFNDEEQAYITENEGTHIEERFFQLWTLKESYIKAFGKGLAIPLKDLHFAVNANKISLRFSGKHSDDPLMWQFFSVTLRTRYQLSLTLEQNKPLDSNHIKVIESIPFRQKTVVNTPLTSY